MNYLSTIIVSLVILFLLHSLYSYFMDTLSVKKSKDIISYNIEKYKTLLSKKDNDDRKSDIKDDLGNIVDIDNNVTDNKNDIEQNEMENELLEYAVKLI